MTPAHAALRQRADDYSEGAVEAADADGRSIMEGLAGTIWRLRWDDPLAALALARHLQDLLEDETDELAEDCIRAGASFEDVAVAYGISRQGARQRWATARSETGRRRPGPRARLGTHIADDKASFVFEVNRSFVRYNSPITIPKVCYRFYKEHVGERDVTVVTPDGRRHQGHVRHGVSGGGNSYFQVTCPHTDPNTGLGGLVPGDRVRVATTTSTQGVEVSLEHVE